MTYFRVASSLNLQGERMCAGNGKKHAERREEMVAGNKTTNRLHRVANNGTITILEERDVQGVAFVRKTMSSADRGS